MEKNSKTQNKIVQTYAEDIAKVIEDDKSGLIKKIIHEEEKHEIEKRNLSPESKKNKFFMFLGLLFIFMGLTVLFYFIFTKEVPSVPAGKQFVPIVFLDQSTFLEVTGLNKDKIVETILNEINTTKVKNGGIEGIYLTENKQVIGLRRFISLIKGNFIPGNNPLFVDDNFLMGVVNNEGESVSATVGKDFFILIKVRSVSDVFDSLHTWESKIFSDLHGFFGINISPETKYLLTKEFQDGFIGNKNARILYDSENKTAIMYILANDNSIIITNTENAAQEIMLRLAASQIKK